MAVQKKAGGTGVRKFRLKDYDRVLELWAEGRLPFRPRGRDSRMNLARQIRLPNALFLVAENDGRVVGTVLATHDGRKGWINRLAVDSAYRGKGIGRRLVREAERWLAGSGLSIFACLIEDDNGGSMKFFKRLGYIKHTEILYFSKRKHPGI